MTSVKLTRRVGPLGLVLFGFVVHGLVWALSGWYLRYWPLVFGVLVMMWGAIGIIAARRRAEGPRWPLGRLCAVLGSVVLTAMGLYSISLDRAMSDVCVSSPSPSSGHVLVIDKACLGHACSYDAVVRWATFEKSLGEPDLGEDWSCDGGFAAVWNDDRIDWTVTDGDRIRRGTLAR